MSPSDPEPKNPLHKPGYIQTPADVEPRPLTDREAQEVFDAVAAREDEIAFRYLREGCECRAQLMIEYMVQRGIDPGRAWALAVGRDLAVSDPAVPKGKIIWRNHTAPTVAVEGVEHDVLVIDPSTQPGPITLTGWAGAMRARSIAISVVPLSQPEILEMHRVSALAGQDLDAIIFILKMGQAPIPECGGSGFRIDVDPPEGVSTFAHAEMQQLLRLQKKMGLREG